MCVNCAQSNIQILLGGSKVEGQMLIGYESGYMPTYAIDSQNIQRNSFGT
jgi:hypothetical protein